MLNLKITTVMLLIFSCLNLSAQVDEPINTIVTVVPFLTINSNMNLGMGNLNVVASPYNTQGSAIHNPARMFQSEMNISIAHTPWLRNWDINDAWISDANGHYVINERHAIGFHARRFNHGEREINLIGGGSRISDPVEYYGGLAYSYRASDNLSLGINANYVHSRLWPVNNNFGIVDGQTFSIGFGALYQDDFETSLGNAYYSIGAMVADIGPKISYTDSDIIKSPIPTNASLGGLFGIREIAPKLDVYVAYQMDKLLVPTPDSIDSDANGIQDHQELTLIQGMFGSFTDASGGFKEEWREISHSFGVEAMYNFNTKMRAGLRFGRFYEHYTKGNRKYVTASASFGYAGFYANIGYLFSNTNSPLNNTISMNIGYQIGI